jgi:hypothetical protein
MSRFVFSLVCITIVCLPSLCLGQADVKVPGNVLSEMGRRVGTWETEGKYLGQDFKGSTIVSWAPGKHCLVAHTKSQLMAATGIIGWDPATNEIVETWYRPNGIRIENRISRFSESGREGTSVLHDASGNVKTGKITVQRAPDGKSLSFSATIGDETTIAGTYRRVEEQKK